MQRFRHILCVLEPNQASQLALERAAELAENNQATLMVASVIPRLPAVSGTPYHGPVSVDLQKSMAQEHEERLATLTAPLRERLKVSHRVLTGTSFLEIIREVLRGGHDLVIKCPESPEWLDRLFAGDDMHLLRKCPCPVWFVKSQAPGPYKRILAAVDVDAFHAPEELQKRQRFNEQILGLAASIALSESAELHIVHAWEAVTELVRSFALSPDIPRERFDSGIEQERRQQQQLLDKLMNDTATKDDATRDALKYLMPRTHLVKGSARQEVPALAKKLGIDCLVMGTVARTGIRGFFMGNTAETILEQIDCSVLAIKPPGFATPVTLDA